MTTAVSAQIVTFRLGEDLFAADINEVERVLRYAAPTAVPNVPDWVKGVIEYRTRVVPVIDLRERFELPAAPVDGATRLMVLSSNGDWVAAIVDAVLEVVPLGGSQLAGPPALFRGLAAEFLRGILRRSDRLIIVLDVARLLATHERLTFDTSGRSAADAIAALAGGLADADIASAAGRASPRPGSGIELSGPGEAAAPTGPESVTATSPDAGPGPGSGDDSLVTRGLAGADAGPLVLLSTSDEAPRPDESILGAAARRPDDPVDAGTPQPPADDESEGVADGSSDEDDV